jgi:hypothetical protein
VDGFARQLGGQTQPCGLCLSQLAQPLRHPSDGGKYGPLRDHLASRPGDRARMTFAEVEGLVGRLSDSAHRHRAWWGTTIPTWRRRHGWTLAGIVESVNQASGEVVFARSTVVGQARSTRRSLTGQPAPCGAGRSEGTGARSVKFIMSRHCADSPPPRCPQTAPGAADECVSRARVRWTSKPAAVDAGSCGQEPQR